MIKLEKFTPIILIIVSIAFILFFYSDVVLSPNSYLFSESGDGLKNYFTYVGHAKNDTSLIESHLMNYPYGENFLYLDCHPLFTMCLKMLSVPFPAIQNYSVGIINFLIIFSIVISAFFIYLLLVEFKVRKLFSATGALAIALLAPQLFRVTGHLALSYSFFIPMSWYLYVRFTKDMTKIKWLILLFINNLMWYFIHAYLGMIVVSFILLCFVIDAFVNKGKKVDQWLKILIVTIMPMVLFWTFTIATDSHLGRTDNPYGFLIYTSNFESVFLPSKAPFRPLLDKMMKIDQNWEGLAYIGVGSIVAILLLIGIESRKYFQKKSLIIPKTPIAIATYAALILLLLSMGYPFKLKMEFLLDWFPIIKNFRGIGRFSWVFFYVATIGSFVYLNHLYLVSKRKLPVLIVAVFVSFSFFAEALPYHYEVSRIINKSPNLFDERQLPETFLNGLKQIEKEKYQAIIPLPYYHIGSENNWKAASDKIYKISMLLAYHSGIPLMGNYSTRTSIPEARKLMQFFSPSFYQKEIEGDFQCKLPFLLVFSNEELLEGEQQVLSKGRMLFSNSEYSLLSVPFDSLFENISKKEIENFQNLRNHLHENNGFFTTSNDTTSLIIFESFDGVSQNIRRSGLGAFKCIRKDYSKLIKIEPKRLKINKEYILSFWMKIEGDNFGQDALGASVFVEAKTPNGELKRIVTVNPMNSFDINKSWVLVESVFKLEDDKDEISIIIKGDDHSKKFFIIDDLLIREKENTVYKVEHESNGRIVQLFKNNHRIIVK